MNVSATLSAAPPAAPAAAPLAIEVRKAYKSFGHNPVLQGVDLHVPAGKTYAFLGRNGQGKTTTIRMLMGLLKPDTGFASVLGHDPVTHGLTIRRDVGYLAEDQQMWGWMRVREILAFVAPFYPSWNWDYATTLLQKFALPANAKIKHLSKGQNVRLGLLLALAHRPRLVILDDPALGLDPIMRKEFLRDVVEHLQGQGVTVFFSSHLLYEVEPVADMVGILDQGRLVCEADTEDLRERVKQFIVDETVWTAHSATVGKILDIKRDNRRIAAIVENAPTARAALGDQILEEIPLNLDEIFEAYVAGKVPAATVHRATTQDAETRP